MTAAGTEFSPDGAVAAVGILALKEEQQTEMKAFRCQKVHLNTFQDSPPLSKRFFGDGFVR